MRTCRILLILTATLGAAAGPVSATGSTSGDSLELLILESGPGSEYATAMRGFRDLLQSRGIQEGPSTRFQRISPDEWDAAQGRPALAKRAAAAKPDLVVAVGTRALRRAARELSAYPILFFMVLDPRVSGLDLSTCRATGITLQINPLASLEVLREIHPAAERIGFVHSVDGTRGAEELAAEAHRMGYRVLNVQAASTEELPRLLRYVLQETDCYFLLPDPILRSPEAVQFLLSSAARYRKPVHGLSPRFVQRGALFSVSADYYEVGRSAGRITLRVLQEDRDPSNIPWSRPGRTILTINRRVSRTLGLPLPPSILERAVLIDGPR